MNVREIKSDLAKKKNKGGLTMLFIQGDFESVKTEMKKKRKSLVDEVNSIKRFYKKELCIPNHQHTKLVEKEHLIKVYSVTQVLPVRIGSLVINYKALTAFMKKVKRFETSLEVSESEVKLHYWMFGRKNRTKGTLTLNDLSIHFKDFTDIPVAEWEVEEVASY